MQAPPAPPHAPYVAPRQRRDPIALWAAAAAGVALIVAVVAIGIALNPPTSHSASHISVSVPPVPLGSPVPEPSPTSTPTFAGPTTDLHLPGFGDMAIDPSHDHLFVSGGPESNDVVVLDFDGRIVKRLTGQLGASGMVVRGANLFIALHNADQVAVFDTGTLQRIKTIDTSPLTGPYGLAWVGNELWVARGACDGGFGDGVFTLDPSTGEIGKLPKRFSGSSCPAVVPIRGDRVLVSGVPLGVGEYDLKSDGGLRTVVELPGSGYSTAVVAPDGRHLLTPGNDRAASVSLANLQPSGTDYIAESFVVGIDVAAAPISRVVVGTDTVYGPDVWLYRADNPQPYGKVDFGDGGPASTLYVNGVTFSPSGDRVFAITGNAGNNAGDDVFLRIVPAAR